MSWHATASVRALYVPILAILTVLTIFAESVRAQSTAPPDTTTGTHRVVAAPRGYTGYGFSQFTAAIAGPTGLHTVSVGPQVVTSVTANSPAAKAGLVVGDTVLEINGVDAATETWPVPMPGVRYILRIKHGDDERELVIMPVAMRAPSDTHPHP